MAIDWRWVVSGLCIAGLMAGCPDTDQPGPVPTDAGASYGHHDRADDADAGAQGEQDQQDMPSEPADAPHARSGAGGSGASDSHDKAGRGGTGGQGGLDDRGGAEAPQPGGGADDRHFFLPTLDPTNTTAPTLLSDRHGGTHMLYPTYGAGGAFYAYCAEGCAGADDVKPVLLQTDGTVGNAALALTADGKPRALLSTYLRVYYAQCDADCGATDSWTVTPIIEHQADQDVTGQALALDAQGRPRFVMHTYLAYLGVGQKPPKTWFVQCDSDCNDPSSWQQHEISEDKIWFGSQLSFDSTGRAHVLTGVENADGMSAGIKLAAYFECDGDCGSADAWNGIGLTQLYESQVEEMRPSLSLALTRAGQPRVLLLERGGPNGRRLLYFECAAQCTEDHWSGSALSDLMQLGSGLDLVLDAQDQPRFVFTLDDNIGFYRCDSPSCASDDADWQLTKVEFAADVPKDDIILWPNCTIDAWILHSPSLALADDGAVRVGYQATDLSGGVKVIDPNQPSCVAGKDMTLSRMTLLAADQIQ